MHEYDPETGQLVRTVVTREPEWDDHERNLMLALSQFETECCAGCGYHESLTGDRENHFTPDVRKCPVCAGSDQFGRVQKAADDETEKAMGKDVAPSAVRPADGRTTFMRPMNADEVAARKEAQKMGPSSTVPH